MRCDGYAHARVRPVASPSPGSGWWRPTTTRVRAGATGKRKIEESRRPGSAVRSRRRGTRRHRRPGRKGMPSRRSCGSVLGATVIGRVPLRAGRSSRARLVAGSPSVLFLVSVPWSNAVLPRHRPGLLAAFGEISSSPSSADLGVPGRAETGFYRFGPAHRRRGHGGPPRPLRRPPPEGCGSPSSSRSTSGCCYSARGCGCMPCRCSAPCRCCSGRSDGSTSLGPRRAGDVVRHRVARTRCGHAEVRRAPHPAPNGACGLLKTPRAGRDP